MGGYWDHPRACGEHYRIVCIIRVETGSSPRLRGTRRAGRRSAGADGIIPALAGNTAVHIDFHGVFWDHPRACGEHWTGEGTQESIVGSSPRLRGTPIAATIPAPEKGIIPALAGNTGAGGVGGVAGWDHPRACGEHEMTLLENGVALGSSPRLRGTQQYDNRQHGNDGIIPALAGNTILYRIAISIRWDHPRACGEHIGLPLSKDSNQGSSPRLRGTQAGTAEITATFGIIPALAGNTMLMVTVSPALRDHPRACGEHPPIEFQMLRTAGSSPRLRGTPDRDRPATMGLGIIPALAGNTNTCCWVPTLTRDHPRACGEHIDTRLRPKSIVGSSPRLRGTRHGCRSRIAQGGIIPALAGNTASRQHACCS